MTSDFKLGAVIELEDLGIAKLCNICSSLRSCYLVPRGNIDACEYMFVGVAVNLYKNIGGIYNTSNFFGLCHVGVRVVHLLWPTNVEARVADAIASE